MPEPSSKVLYKSIDELHESADQIVNTVQNIKSVAYLLKSITKCVNEGRNKELNGELEMAYLYYYRCIILVQRLIKLNEFKNDEFYLKTMIKDPMNDSMKRLEYLKPILERWYEENQQREPTKTGDSELSTHVEDVKPCAPRISTNGIELRSNNEEREFISCAELNQMVTRKSRDNISILIIDVRSKSDFEKSRMKFEDVINIPIHELPGTLTPHAILNKHLAVEFKPFFKRRKQYDWVVIVDWSSTYDIRDTELPIGKMMTTLMKWDVNEPYRRKPVVLDGGFEDWLSYYPLDTTNPAISPPRMWTSDTSFLDDIKFPDACDLDTAFIADFPSNVNGQPTVDRSTKPIFREEKTESKNNGVNTNKKLADDNGTLLRRISNGGIESPKDSKVRFSNELSDSDSDGGKHYSQRGRRSALANTMGQAIYPDMTKGNDEDEGLDNDAAIHRDKDEDHQPESTFEGGRSIMANITDLKRSSSTPNILKLSTNEGNRPLVDRSTKPLSLDDQFSILSMYDNYNSIETGRGLTGLKNLGNTCYMNSIIQCLSNTEPLKESLRTLDPRKIINNPQSKTRGQIASKLRAIFAQLWSSDGGSVSCKELKTIVGEHRDTFRGYEQQDSHEFLTILIDWLHEDLKQTPQSVKLDGADENSGEKAWGEFTSKNDSIVRKLFYGQLKSTVCCSDCKKESITFEPFSNLSLPLPTEEKCSLTDCIRLYTKDESITGWQCPGCKTSRNATKKLDITKLPPLLVIHLKRFTSDGWCRKRLTNVDFPPVLDMSDFVTGNEHRFSRYRLYAVSNHYGTMESGHYTAYCWNAPSKSWYKFDDQEVTSLNGSVPKLPAAYIVFYQFITSERMN